MTAGLPDPPLLIMTDRKQARRDLLKVAEAAFRGGARGLSLREKDLDPDAQRALLRATEALEARDRARQTFARHNLRLVVKLAQRYRYFGDLSVDIWYDGDGRWVKMQFTAKDGSSIEYVCRSCRRDGAAA